MATRPKASKRPRVLLAEPPADQRAPSPSPSPRIAPASEAVAKIFADYRERGDGVGIVVVGDRGSGKSVTMRYVLDRVRAERGMVALSLVVDDKGWPQYRGCVRVDLAHADEVPPGELRDEQGRELDPADSRDVVVFNGDAALDLRPDPEEIANACKWYLQVQKTRVCLVVDEAKRVTTAGLDGDGRRFTCPSVKWMFTESRQVGSPSQPCGGVIIMGNQAPQELPRSGKDGCFVLIMRGGPGVANYVRDSWFMPPEMCDQIRRLPVGHFVLMEPGKTEWDGTVYKVPAPGASVLDEDDDQEDDHEPRRQDPASSDRPDDGQSRS
jgi:hypothetical protein